MKTSTSEQSEDEGDDEEMPEDVSQVIYILITNMEIADINLDLDFNKYRLEEFKFHDARDDMIKRVAKAGVKAKKEFEEFSNSVIIQFKSFIKKNDLPIMINDDSGWKKVEEFFENYMRLHKQEIRVQ